MNVSLRYGLAAIALASLPLVAARAQDARFVLGFGAEPGAVLPHAYSYGKPPEGTTLTMRVPLTDAKLAPLLQDVELTLDLARNIITRVRNERAYKSVMDCTNVRKVVEEKLAELMPKPYTGSDSIWQHQTESGSAVGGVVCRTERWLPYPVLILDMAEAPR